MVPTSVERLREGRGILEKVLRSGAKVSQRSEPSPSGDGAAERDPGKQLSFWRGPAFHPGSRAGLALKYKWHLHVERHWHPERPIPGVLPPEVSKAQRLFPSLLASNKSCS